jgi:Big-like domain-containing protein
VGDVRHAIRRATLTIASLVVLGIPVVLATPQAASAATACTRVGNIQVTDTDDNTVVGYVSKTWNVDGQFVVTTTPSDYLSARVTDGAQTNIASLNVQSDLFVGPAFVGATTAIDQASDLATGSALYSSLGGTTSTAPGATPHYTGNSLTNAFDIEEPDESAIWTDAPGTPGALLTAQWINTDGSLAPTHLVVEAGELAVTGDPTALAMAFNGLFDPVFDVALNFVPTAPSSGPCATTTTLSPTASAAGGSPVTFTAAVTPSPIADGAPTGPVSFSSDGTPIAGCTSQAPSASAPFTATCTTSALTAGGSPHSIVATFAGDADDQVSTSPAVSQQITPAPTTTTLAALPASASVFGQSVAFTATVTSGDGGGSVAFKDGATTLAGCGAKALSGSGPYTATCTTSVLAVGSHSIVATYTGDVNFTGGASSALPYTVNQAPTTTALAASPASPSVFGQSVAFTATVTGGDGGGSVAFKDGATTLAGCGAKALSGSGPYIATCMTSALTVGSHSIVATYTGDTNFTGGASTALHYTVNQAPTTTTLAASPTSSSVFGQPVTFTATVTGGDGGGSVAFKDGSTTLTGCGAKALSGSGPYTATCTTSTLTVGSHSIVATYSGDTNFTGGASTALPYTVNQAATTTTLSASPSGSSSFGQSVTFTATVAATAPGAGAPTGTVAFTIDGTPAGSSGVSGSGQATLSTSSLGAGSHVIAATYSGDGNFLTSSGSLAQSVTCAVTITGARSGTLTVSTSTCLSAHATVTSAIIVSGAGTLDLEGASVSGAISVSGGSGAIRICGTSVGGAVDIKNHTGLVIIGDPGDAACAPNKINGALLLANNTGGVEAIDNTEHGLSASGNSGPGPFPGDPTTISGNHT